MKKDVKKEFELEGNDNKFKNYPIDFSKLPCAYWSDSAKISYLQRRIIVWSIMYYEHDESCVPDRTYDEVSKQLVALQNSVSEQEWERSTYYYAMYDFDGNTGFDIPSRLSKQDREYLTHIANVIHKQWSEGQAK